VSIAQIARRVLDEKAPSQRRLRLGDVGHDDIEALLGIGQRQQVIKIVVPGDAPGEVLGNEERLGSHNQGPKLPEMLIREPLGAAKRQADTMQA
jgi:hypothetical protein